jgi:TolB protein
MAGSFPIGYPAAVALFHTFVRDFVVAGRVVSFVTGVGSGIVLYLLAKRYVRKEHALLCTLLLVLNPLFIRLSLMTMSESLYIFLVLLGLLFFVCEKYLPFGLAMGAAAITRPEALAIVGILALTKLRKPKHIAVIAVSFAAVYSLNVVVLSKAQGRLIIVPKTGWIGSSAKAYTLRETSFDFEGKKDAIEKMKSEHPDKSLFVEYIQRFPEEVLLLVRHLLPALFLLCVFGLWRRRKWFLLAPLVPFFVYPLVTPRIEDRFVLPYIPILLLSAIMGLESVHDKRLRSVVSALVLLSVIALPFVNKHVLAPEHEFGSTKEAGLFFRDKIKPGEKIADRKPFLAFYAGGQYVEIPVGPYDLTLQHLCDQKVRYLSLHRATIEAFRPALVPLLYDEAVLAGEMRFEQVYLKFTGEMVLEQVRRSDPLRWEKVRGYADDNSAPSWSSDGQMLAFRSFDEAGNGSICITSVGQTLATQFTEENTSDDQLAWSPDGRLIAFSSSALGNMDVYVLDLATRKWIYMISSEGEDRSPSWSSDGRLIVFASNRTGQDEIWLKVVRTGEERQLTEDGGNTHPAISPSGDRIAWTKEGQGIVIMDVQTGSRMGPRVPGVVAFAPAWSPDENYLAVAARDWGSWDIYLLKADGSGALLLTKDPNGQGMPSWRSDGRALAIHSEHGGESAIWILTGLEPYLDRLDNPVDLRTFERETP